MKMNFKSLLAGNLITVIIIFVLLSFFDQSGDSMRNIIVVFVGFVLMTSYDFIRTRKDKKKQSVAIATFFYAVFIDIFINIG